MKRIAVIGAGISGLSVAHFLEEEYAVKVFEKESQPGGLIRCRKINGSLFHTCGGHVFNSKRQDVLNWFWRRFNRENEFAKADRNSVIFMDNGKEIPYPIENHVYMMDRKTQTSIITNLLYINKLCSNPANFEDFLKGRFGDTLYNLYFKPYNEKVWRCDLKNVPLTWLEGKLPMPTVEEIIFNNMNHIEEKNFVHSSFWYEKKNGSQYIADKLAQNLDIQYNSDIKQICYKNGKWIVCEQEFDNVVFCGNIKQVVHVLKGLDISSFKDRVDSLQYHGTTTAFCMIDSNPYSWIYLPSDKHQSHRIICTGNFNQANNSAEIPLGRITGTVEFTDRKDLEEIKENLKHIPLNPELIDYKYNEYTYPVQNSETRNMIDSLKVNLASSGFYFTGRFADWEYYNMDAAIGAAMDMIHRFGLVR